MKLFLLILALTALVSTLRAQVPQLVNYQGRVVSGAANFDGTGLFKFALVDGAGATTFWSNDGTSTAGGEPAAAVPLVVNKGLFTVLLGNATLPNMTVLPNSAFNHADVRLRTWFSDGVNGFELLTPDQRIAAVGYAIMAAGVMDGAITSSMLAPGAVGSGALATNAVQAGNIAPGAVGAGALANGSVGAAALQQNAVEAGHIANGAVGASALANNSVGAAAIQDGEIKPEHLAAGAVTAGAMAPGSVGAAALQAGAVQAGNIANGAVTNAALGAAAVSAANLQKPPGSGTISGATLDYEFGVAEFTHTFDGAFATQPVVTLSISTPPGGAAGAPPASYLWVTSSSTTSFSGRVDIGASARSVDSSGVVGEHPAGALIEDVPAFSFFDRTGSSIKYVRLINGSQPLTVAASEKDHGFNSLAYVNGAPCIAYYGLDGGDEVLRFIRATDNLGEKWEDPPVTIDYATVTGGDLVLLVVNGRPAICYHDGGYLKFVRASNASGTAWGSAITLASTGGGSDKSMAIVNGNPAIAYHHAMNADLMFIRATDPNGTSWAAPVVVDASGSVGRYNSLAVVSGNPAISYHDQTNGNLNFIRALDASGSAWGPSVTVDSDGNVGLHTSLAVVDGLAAISYHDQTRSDLKYVRATLASGIAWGSPATIDSHGASGSQSFLLVTATGEPVIASYDSQGGDLKIISESDATPRPFTINWIALEP